MNEYSPTILDKKRIKNRDIIIVILSIIVIISVGYFGYMNYKSYENNKLDNIYQQGLIDGAITITQQIQQTQSIPILLGSGNETKIEWLLVERICQDYRAGG